MSTVLEVKVVDSSAAVKVTPSAGEEFTLKPSETRRLELVNPGDTLQLINEDGLEWLAEVKVMDWSSQSAFMQKLLQPSSTVRVGNSVGAYTEVRVATPEDYPEGRY